MQGLRYKLEFFCFTNQDTIECMINFMIDGRTIKRRV